MGNENEGRLVFMANRDVGVIVIRPIGYMTGADLVERVFESYGDIDAPWTFNRLIDLRRFKGHISDGDLKVVGDRWQAMAEGRPYHIHVAVLSEDIIDQTRMPSVGSMLPNVTMRMFSNFHQAMGWLQATDREAYPARLDTAGAIGRPDPRIRIG